jgi:hypothetical protein
LFEQKNGKLLFDMLQNSALGRLAAPGGDR